ncbi:hypothetical protein [Ectobacillus panaciterrae]|uniref:hypothetical protein n=1 Tax=Ectobacillus panaciterrae TaxID=363872 RepID=UPI00040074C5|nr:hypothetical protein [Ectobacillus panaciterrae]
MISTATYGLWTGDILEDIEKAGYLKLKRVGRELYFTLTERAMDAKLYVVKKRRIFDQETGKFI